MVTGRRPPAAVRAGRSLDEARLSGPGRGLLAGDGQASAGKAETATARRREAIAAQAGEYLRLLAAAYQAAGRVDLAIGVLTEHWSSARRRLGPGHPETLTARGRAGPDVPGGRADGRGDPAVRADAGRPRVGARPRPSRDAGRPQDLAAAYRAAGRTEDAINVFRRTLTDQELVLGEDHPTTVATRGSLASALHSAGRIKDAIPLYVQTLADRERLLGPDHLDTLTARGNLAYAYRSAGKLKEAIPLYARPWPTGSGCLGPDHLDTITSRANLAAAYYSARKLKEALPLYERTWPTGSGSRATTTRTR